MKARYYTLTLIIVLSFIVPISALGNTKKVAILEIIDKEGKIEYAAKLMIRSSLATAVTHTPGFEGYARTNIDQILKEQNFQRTGLVSKTQIKSLGEMMGAQYVLIAEAVMYDKNTMLIVSNITDVESGEIIHNIEDFTTTSPEQLKASCRNIAKRLFGWIDLGTPSKSRGSSSEVVTMFQSSEELYKKGVSLYGSKRYKEAVRLFQLAANKGYDMAQFRLGKCFLNGTGVTKNLTAAIDYMTKAAEQGDPALQWHLGMIYYQSKAFSDALQWLRKAANQGHLPSQKFLGEIYSSGRGVTKNSLEAVKWYREAAEQGDAYSQCKLGSCYEKGLGVAKDYHKAIDLYNKAANQNNEDALYRLGVCYDKGLGVAKDYHKAIDLYHKAAERGNSEAQYELGNSYSSGILVKQNYKESFKWYHKAAERGHSEAQYKLGISYQSGIHGAEKQDYKEAFEWYCKAAKNGHSKAQYELGTFYYLGLGVAKNPLEAVKWYGKAAKQENSDALYRLGSIYYYEFVDYNEARKWLNKYLASSDNPYYEKEAKKLLRKIK